MRTGALSLACAVTLAVCTPTAVPAQPGAPGQSPRPGAKEAALKAAIESAPGELRHYLALADYYQRLGLTTQVDGVLRSALRATDPLSRDLYQRRVMLYVEPFQPMLIAAIAHEWLAVDGTYPVPVLLAAGQALRSASAHRGDGTAKSLSYLDEGLRFIDGALPAQPDDARLLLAKSSLLVAKAMLIDENRSRPLLEEAQVLQQRADELTAAAASAAPALGPAAPAVAAMMQMPPFGPRGAVRVGVVPRPRQVKGEVPRLKLPVRSRPRLVALELVIGVDGRVVQAYAVNSVQGFDKTLAAMLEQWLFEPTTHDGRQVEVITTMSIPYGQ